MSAFTKTRWTLPENRDEYVYLELNVWDSDYSRKFGSQSSKCFPTNHATVSVTVWWYQCRKMRGCLRRTCNYELLLKASGGLVWIRVKWFTSYSQWKLCRWAPAIERRSERIQLYRCTSLRSIPLEWSKACLKLKINYIFEKKRKKNIKNTIGSSLEKSHPVFPWHCEHTR